MRSKCLSVVIIFMFIATFFLFLPSVSADPAVMVYSYTLSPEVFMPGDSGVLNLVVKNAETTSTYTSTSTSGTHTATTTDTIGATIKKIWINSANDGLGKYVKASSYYEDVGYLGPTNSIAIEFEIAADDNITEGLYFPNVRINVEESNFEDVTYPFKVKVSNSTVNLIGADIPSKISVSGSTDITLTVVNNREASVDAVTIIPEEIDGIDFVQDSVFVGELDSYSSQDVTFSIIPTETGFKNLSFNLSFRNGDNVHNEETFFSIEVIETLDVAPVLYSIPSTIGRGRAARVRIEVYNAKTDSISGVIVTPISDVIITPSQYFIGSMDADDVFSASFDIYTHNLDIGSEYTIDFKVSFKQGDEYYETPSVSTSFEIVTPSTSGEGGVSLITISFFVVIAVALFLLYKWRKRRSN